MISKTDMKTSIETKPRCLTKWLDKNFDNRSSKSSYEVALKNWIKCFYGKDSVTYYRSSYFFLDGGEKLKRNTIERMEEIEEGIDLYFRELDDRDFADDFKTFLKWARNEGYSNLYIRDMGNSCKKFFSRQDPRCKISDDDWDDIKRTLLPKSKRAATQDDILTKQQLKKVLHHLSIHGKALALFLLSAGPRITASCRLKMNDIFLDSDPPYAEIREEYTKGKVGGRRMWFSYEARDAIIAWHKDRLFKKKPGSLETYDADLVFNFTRSGFAVMWNKALKRADGKRDPPVLCKRDPSTKLEMYVYHVHTLRKFFRTEMSLAGVPDTVVHGWMGHRKYLSQSYDRLGMRRMAQIYKDNMYAVTINKGDLAIENKKDARIKELEAELAGLKETQIDRDVWEEELFSRWEKRLKEKNDPRAE